jgi:hypothetical protein
MGNDCAVIVTSIGLLKQHVPYMFMQHTIQDHTGRSTETDQSVEWS